MTEHIPDKQSAGSPTSQRSGNALLVVPHEPIDERTILPFAQWLEAELTTLEYRFRHLVTPQTIKKYR